LGKAASASHGNPAPLRMNPAAERDDWAASHGNPALPCVNPAAERDDWAASHGNPALPCVGMFQNFCTFARIFQNAW